MTKFRIVCQYSCKEEKDLYWIEYKDRHWLDWWNKDWFWYQIDSTYNRESQAKFWYNDYKKREQDAIDQKKQIKKIIISD
jgi:hypothetical protein